MKKGIGLFLAMLLVTGMFPSMAIAEENSSKDAVVAKAKSPVQFQINTTKIKPGVKDAFVDDIILTEAEPGLLKKGKVIYLEAETLPFQTGATAEVLEGDIKIKSVKARDGVLAIEIDRASSKESVIKITGLKLDLNRDLPQGSYGIDLIVEAGNGYPNNFFGENYGDDDEQGKFSTKKVRLLDEFVILSDDGEITNPELTSNYFYPQIHASAGDGFFTLVNSDQQEKQISFKGEIYKKDGFIMLPLRAAVEALTPSVIINWDQQTQTCNLLMGSRIVKMSVDEKIMVVNGTEIPSKSIPEIKDGILYLSLEDLALALGRNSNQVQYDESTNSAVLN